MNPYEVLEIPSDASDEEIRAAYKRLSQKYHPDKEGGDTDKFIDVANAYVKLKRRTCPNCNGRGTVRVRNGHFTKVVECPQCWEKK